MGQKTKKAARRAEAERRLEAERAGLVRRKSQLRWLVWAALPVTFVAVLGIALAVRGGASGEAASGAPSGASASGALAGSAIPIQGQEHVQAGTDVDYSSNPPTSGAHWPQPSEWTIYPRPVPDEMLVHNLEHGGIWISHKGIDAATRQKLEALAAKYPQAVVLSPRPQNDESGIALASWGRLQKLTAYDEGRIVAFISANVNKSPEPLASIAPPKVEVGRLFPDFELTEASTGQVLTRASLRGKPSIVWFTTSYCIPCQIGAKPVAALDDELGGKAFDLLIVFVDPQEPPSALLWWRDQFARPDWLVALDADNSLAQAVGLRFLDTKFLLDSSGVIRDIDFQVANDRYVKLIRKAVEADGP